MGRGITKNANAGYGNAQAMGETANLRGQNIYNELFPQLSREATNPQGYGTVGLNAMNTANQQSIGGSNAAAAGEGAQAAARTRNAGAYAPMVAEANRAGQRQLSQNALGIQGENEQLRNSQQQNALKALQGLYGTQMNTALGAGNLSNDFLRTGVQSAAQTTGAWQGLMKMLMPSVSGSAGGMNWSI